ncbi:FAD-binding domain-containing protein [Aspergillus sclerotiicarbonarius CBS 121057]|uniref:FAD-binding domain-containing protein n=1 Tax=Aspergillus sclerotiicarbonarius (strain CBS 121057 / IBT 28362) TaxID=1448318 RepID=A0A319ECQ7_ASPSB|nr:FAD-binding domain-containing protein [Aspergillus sclerotiicarbonarius CBS 121057]
MLGPLATLALPAHPKHYQALLSFTSPKARASASSFSFSSSSSCRCFPGDTCWPSPEEWTALNVSLSGNLLAIDPIGSVCHTNTASHDNEKCATLQKQWSKPATHYDTPSSPMAPWWSNASCSPFSAPDSPCTVGPLVRYAVNVTSAADVQHVLRFVQSKNIRLVIRNTGHDYMGKSTGAGALALWTHHLKSIETFPNYTSGSYTGPAMRIGAGVQGFEAQNAAHEAGYVMVTGHCPDVGIAGGYTQGGGHGPLASRYGLAADQVLEWEVITADGQLRTASPSQNEDLYWALSGGGGGTFAVVLGMTVRVYPEEPSASAMLSFTSVPTSETTSEAEAEARFWSVVRTFLLDTLPLLDTGGTALWMALPGAFTGGPLMFAAGPISFPGATKAELEAHLASILQKLQDYGTGYESAVTGFPNYHASVADTAVDVAILNQNAVVSGYNMNVSRQKSVHPNSANPAWRNAAVSVVLGIPFSYTDTQQNLAGQKLMTEVLVPELEALGLPGELTGAYLNEADFNTPHWQEAFYGAPYARLGAVKDKYDPDQIFYGRTAVGSERWVEQADGRLCRAA